MNLNHGGTETRRKKEDLWSLRPEDRLDPAFLKDPRLQHLEENAVFRLLILIRHKNRRKFRLTMALTLFGTFAFSAFYAFYMRGMGGVASLVIGLTVDLVLSIHLAFWFFVGGIKGYEASRELQPYLEELYLSGVSGEDIARAIWGRTLCGYSSRKLRRWIILAWMGLLGLIFAIHPNLQATTIQGGLIPLIPSLLLLGFAWGFASRIPHILIGGSLIWISGQRRRVQQRAKPLASMPADLQLTRKFRFGVFGFLCLCFLLPTIFYLIHLIGRNLVYQMHNWTWALITGLLGPALLWTAEDWWARVKLGGMDRNFQWLANEIDLWFRLKMESMHG